MMEERKKLVCSLIDRYGGKTFLPYAIRLTRNLADAEDLVQTCLLRAIEKSNLYIKDEGMFTTWVYKIIRNEFINNVRLKGKRESCELRDDLKYEESNNKFFEEKRKFNKSIRGLQYTFRSVLILRIKFSMTYREIAEFLEIPLGTVKNRIHTAKELLFNKQYKTTTMNTKVGSITLSFLDSVYEDMKKGVILKSLANKARRMCISYPRVLPTVLVQMGIVEKVRKEGVLHYIWKHDSPPDIDLVKKVSEGVKKYVHKSVGQKQNKDLERVEEDEFKIDTKSLGQPVFEESKIVDTIGEDRITDLINYYKSKGVKATVTLTNL